MSSLLLYPTSSLKSTASTQSSSRLHPLPIPASRRLLVDEWEETDDQEQYQDDDDDFLFGFSAKTMDAGSTSSQRTDDDCEVATPPPSSLPDNTEIQGDFFHEGTFPESFFRSPSSQLPRKAIDTQADPAPPSSLSLSLPIPGQANAEIHEDDDDAFLQLLMKQQEQRRNVKLVPVQPQPVVLEPAPETRRSNDPLELLFQVANENSDVDMEETLPRIHYDDDDIGAKTGGDREHRRDHAVRFLESLLLDFWTQLHSSAALLSSPTRTKGKNKLSSQTQDDGSQKKEPMRIGLTMCTVDRKTGYLRELVFPHDPARTPKKPVLLQMTRILFVASVLYDAILNDSLVTLRDVYYRDVGLFKHQRVVDSIVDDLVATAGLTRDHFHVCAAVKGLIASKAIRITLSSGEGLSLSSTIPTLIPRGDVVGEIAAPDGLDWILVVEKDAVMQTLCGSRLLEDNRLGPGVIVTGKGYPDLSTLQLLRRLANQFPLARVYALVDADPHGIGILSVYGYGSNSNRHSEQYAGLALGDRIEFLGVKATEWARIAPYESLLPLGARDAQLATKMCAELSDVSPEWRRELVHMLHLNRKAEIQILSGPSSGEGAMGFADVSFGTSSNRLIEYIVSKIAPSRSRKL